MPGAHWFSGATLNYAERALRRRDDDTALIAGSESGAVSSVSYRELHERVGAVAAGLRRLGVERGDSVAALMPNIPETVIAFLAASSLGAIWSTCSPEFGVTSIVDRFRQIEPKVLLAVDGYRYGGRAFPRLDAVSEIQAGLPGAGADGGPSMALGRPRPGGPGFDHAVERAGVGAGRPDFRARAVRSSPLGPLLVRDDGAAQADSPGARRHPARAPEGAVPAHRDRPGRPLLLVHDDRVDDVELPDRRAASRRDGGAVRRRSGLSRHERALEASPRRRK